MLDHLLARDHVETAVGPWERAGREIDVLFGAGDVHIEPTGDASRATSEMELRLGRLQFVTAPLSRTSPEPQGIESHRVRRLR